MKAKARKSRANELQFELKYCERCGGLWLRPAGGGQIYCVNCGRQMAQLPPVSREPEKARKPRRPRRDADDGDFEGFEGLDLDAAGGVA
jgi:Zn-finger nucleic acid-binding protein